MAVEVVAIRREDKGPWERRTPLTPAAARRLRDDHGVRTLVQPSERRIFSDRQFTEAGATVTEELAPAKVIFGVKEVPRQLLLPEKTYVFFSHVIKGQTFNMPMLARILDLGCTLIDYERVIDDDGQRLIFFGRYAGLAGMIDTLSVLGHRLRWEGFANPFTGIDGAYSYPSLTAARAAVRFAGERLAAEGLPAAVSPLIIGVAGYGNVAGGAQEILAELPTREITPDEVAGVATDPGAPRNVIFRVTYREEDLVEPVAAGASFDLYDYYARPERYRTKFTPHLDHLSVLLNCVYWDSRYPRLVTLEDVHRLWAPGAPQPRLRVIGDLSCDIEGGIECTIKVTEPDNPVYVFEPATGFASSGVAGRGPVVLAVDILPSELPLEASEEFSQVLGPLVPDIARANYSVPLRRLALPAEIRRAVIAYRGELTPDYQYLKEFITVQRP